MPYAYNGYDEGVPDDLYLPEKEGYEYGKITWCNTLKAPIRGYVGLSIEATIPESWTGNEAATEEMQFYNMAGIFCKIPPSLGRRALPHVPLAAKRQRVDVSGSTKTRSKQ